MKQLGGMESMMDKIPGMGNMTQMSQQKDITGQFSKMEYIIDSMTPKERANPDILNGSRKKDVLLRVQEQLFKT